VARDAERAAPRIDVAYVAVSGVYAPLWMAADRGLFKDYGVEVSLRYLDPTAGVQAMIAGDIDLYAGGTAALDAAMSGAEVVYIGSLLDKFVLSLFALPEIGEIGDLRGNVLGVSQPGTPTYAGAQIVLRRVGLVAGRDVTLAYLAGGGEILAALQRRTIQAGMLHPPLTALARKAGLRELEDLGTLPARFPQTAFVVTRAYLRSHAALLTQFVKGYIEGVKAARANPGQAMEVIARYTHVTEPAVNRENYDAFAPWWEVPPVVSEAGLQTALSLSTHPRAGSFQPKDLIDHQIIQRLSDLQEGAAR
jgi:NitT/TauT family transport system substrate-binding protein